MWDWVRIILGCIGVFVFISLVGASCEETIYDGLSVDETARLLSNNGFKAERAQGPQGQPYLKSEVHGYGFEVHFFSCNGDKKCYGVGLSLGIKKTPKTTWQLINSWNAKARMVNAYLVDDGVILEMEMPVGGGVTKKNIEYQLAGWKGISAKFEEVLRTGNP